MFLTKRVVLLIPFLFGIVACQAQNGSLVENDGPLKIEEERESLNKEFSAEWVKYHTW